MTRFLLIGMGRGGTTAVADELDSHPDIRCLIEPYMNFPKGSHEHPKIGRYWREHAYEGAEPYLDYLERVAGVGVDAFGMKQVDGHILDRREWLLEELHRRGYKVLRMIRRNLARQALSGVVARLRGQYNVRGDTDLDPVEVRPGAVTEAMRAIQRSVELMEGRIALLGAQTFHVYYEHYISDRAAFYRGIFRFLGVADYDLPPTDYQVMVPDPREAVANWSEVAAWEWNGRPLGEMLLES